MAVVQVSYLKVVVPYTPGFKIDYVLESMHEMIRETNVDPASIRMHPKTRYEIGNFWFGVMIEKGFCFKTDEMLGIPIVVDYQLREDVIEIWSKVEEVTR